MLPSRSSLIVLHRFACLLPLYTCLDHVKVEMKSFRKSEAKNEDGEAYGPDLLLMDALVVSFRTSMVAL